MNHRNYSVFSSKKVENKNENENEIKKVEESEHLEEQTEINEANNQVNGVVSDCEKLNVRLAPDKNSEVVCIIDQATELIIELDKSTDDFYKIITSAGLNGYCMKKFVTILDSDK